MSSKNIESRVIEKAEAIIDEKGWVSVIDVLAGIGWLSPAHLFDWKKGRIPFLEKVIQAGPDKISQAIRCFQSWAEHGNLKPGETVYVRKTGMQEIKLTFTEHGDENLDRAYRTHYIHPQLSETKVEKLKEKLSRPADIIVYIISKDSKCSKCNTDIYKGSMLNMDADKPLCLECANLDHLSYLPSGDAKLTRRTKQYSGLWAVVVKFSRARKRYERQGLLVEKEALEKAEEECGNKKL